MGELFGYRQNSWKVSNCGAGEGWRRSVGPIIWRIEEMLLRVNEQRNILHEIRKRKANWIGHILRRNCLLKQVIEGKIKGGMEVARRRGRRRKKLLDDLKDKRGYSHLKEEALDRTIRRHRFGGGFGPVVRQNTEWMNKYIYVSFPLTNKFQLLNFLYVWLRRSETPGKFRNVVLEEDGEDQLDRSYEELKKCYLESRSRGISYTK